MAIDIIISCCVAVYAVINIVFKQEIRKVREVALSRSITPCPTAARLYEFLAAGTNRRVAARYFYEAHAVHVLFWIALILATLVLSISAIVTVNANVSAGAYDVPEWMMRGIYFAVVMSLSSSLACAVIAGKAD